MPSGNPAHIGNKPGRNCLQATKSRNATGGKIGADAIAITPVSIDAAAMLTHGTIPASRRDGSRLILLLEAGRLGR